jgi:hypothetical protein
MPYIGRGISQLQTIDKLDAITPSTSTGAGPYNLTQSSSAFTPISANNLLISINGVVQYGNFTVSGSTVTFTGALSDSDTCNFILHVGEGVVNTPGAGTVTSSSIVDGSIVGDDINSTFDISSKTVTLPASVSGLGTGITNAQLAGSIANSKLANSSITINGSAVSLGSSTTIATGIEWQSTIVTGATLSATANYGYFIDTSSNACTVTLPGSASVGDEIWFVDYARNFGSNALTINPNSLKYQGNTSPNPVYDTNGQAIHIVYSGTTKGWIPTSDDVVSLETPQTYSADFLVIAGGAGGGGGTAGAGGGGGAGGYRASYNSEASGGGGSSESSLTFSPGIVYTITVGDGGAGGVNSDGDTERGTNGSDSSISGSGITTITSTGGGGGGGASSATRATGNNGGSGGGAGDPNASNTAGSGTSNQGYGGGASASSGNDNYQQGGGGGGAGSVGLAASGTAGGNAGVGVASTITGSSVSRAGGGGGGRGSSASGAVGVGYHGGGDGSSTGNGNAATANTGGGGGGKRGGGSYTGGNGGSGVVILRMPTSNYSGTTSGSPTVTTSGSDTILTFNASGSYTA